MIWELFNLSAKGDGFGGLSADYAVCRDYSDRYSLDRIEIWRVIKGMLSAYQAAIPKKR
jgi:hypothetical protein